MEVRRHRSHRESEARASESKKASDCGVPRAAEAARVSASRKSGRGELRDEVTESESRKETGRDDAEGASATRSGPCCRRISSETATARETSSRAVSGGDSASRPKSSRSTRRGKTRKGKTTNPSPTTTNRRRRAAGDAAARA